MTKTLETIEATMNRVRIQWDAENETWDVIDQHGEYDTQHDTIEEAKDRVREINADAIREMLADMLDDCTNPETLMTLVRTLNSLPQN
jgi:hypothetical protein